MNLTPDEKARIVRVSLTIGLILLFTIIISIFFPNQLLVMVPTEKQLYLKITLAILVSSAITFLIVEINPNKFFQKKESSIVISIIIIITMIFCGIVA